MVYAKEVRLEGDSRTFLGNNEGQFVEEGGVSSVTVQDAI